ncbi:hypothetical protein RIR_jg23728.t1 [Rhizophagus irregularis DAOM 181602=DAOM 197198]|nr:hypothetical protein RIR_jg23728.t1 [Rhizophagus irregularis DAOM 181602=DAOM 197198]
MAEISPAFLDYNWELIVNYHQMKNLQQNTFQYFSPLLLSLTFEYMQEDGADCFAIASLSFFDYSFTATELCSTIASLASSFVFFCSSSLTLTSRLAFSSINCLSFAFSASTSATFLLSSGISAFLLSISANYFLSLVISAKSLTFNSLNESID